MLSGAPQHLPASDRARIEAANRLGSELRSQSTEIAGARRLPAPLVGALSDELLFSLCVPASLGGPECHAETRFRAGEATAIAPFDYIRLLYAIIFDITLFAVFPDAWTILGALVIIGSTLYVARRQARRRPSRADGAAPGAEPLT